MQFSAIVLDRSAGKYKRREKSSTGRSKELKLWGLTLGMTLDLLACMHEPFVQGEKAPGSPSDYASPPHCLDNNIEATGLTLAPSMTCVFV